MDEMPRPPDWLFASLGEKVRLKRELQGKNCIYPAGYVCQLRGIRSDHALVAPDEDNWDYEEIVGFKDIEPTVIGS